MEYLLCEHLYLKMDILPSRKDFRMIKYDKSMIKTKYAIKSKICIEKLPFLIYRVFFLLLDNFKML